MKLRQLSALASFTLIGISKYAREVKETFMKIKFFAYEAAIKERYRFFSFGDAMLIKCKV